MKAPGEAAHNTGFFFTYAQQTNQRSKHLKDKKAFLVSSLQESEQCNVIGLTVQLLHVAEMLTGSFKLSVLKIK
jgi:hypothetical protein